MASFATYEELKSQFGQPVADGVLALTKDKNIEKKTQMSDSIRRIKLQPNEIWMVKMADRITNLQPPPFYWTIEKRKKYLDQAKLILDELKSGSDFLSDRLTAKILEYQSYILSACMKRHTNFTSVIERFFLGSLYEKSYHYCGVLIYFISSDLLLFYISSCNVKKIQREKRFR